MKELTKKSFEKHLNSVFRVVDEAMKTVEVKLVEVSERESEKAYSMSLVFIGPEHEELPQNNYKVEHDKMGTFDLFMVPVGKNEAGIEYQVIFSRFGQ